MSMFGRQQYASQPAPSPAANERLEQATLEVEMVSDMFNRIVRSCFTKCIPNRFLEGTLNKGEGVCVDRCVAKYFLANEVVGNRMKTFNEQSANQAAAAASSSGGGGGVGSFFGM